jgi:hypothetical protein
MPTQESLRQKFARDLAQLDDDGCPNCADYEYDVAEAERRRIRGLTRREKNLVHGGCIAIIIIACIIDGATLKDVGAVALAIVAEVWA